MSIIIRIYGCNAEDERDSDGRVCASHPTNGRHAVDDASLMIVLCKMMFVGIGSMCIPTLYRAACLHGFAKSRARICGACV